MNGCRHLTHHRSALAWYLHTIPLELLIFSFMLLFLARGIGRLGGCMLIRRTRLISSFRHNSALFEITVVPFEQSNADHKSLGLFLISQRPVVQLIRLFGWNDE